MKQEAPRSHRSPEQLLASVAIFFSLQHLTPEKYKLFNIIIIIYFERNVDSWTLFIQDTLCQVCLKLATCFWKRRFFNVLFPVGITFHKDDKYKTQFKLIFTNFYIIFR